LLRLSTAVVLLRLSSGNKEWLLFACATASQRRTNEFADLSENDFKDICLFSEHDWMMFNECSEEEQQIEPVFILSENAFYE